MVGAHPPRARSRHPSHHARRHPANHRSLRYYPPPPLRACLLSPSLACTPVPSPTPPSQRASSHWAAPRWDARVRPNFTFKDALLTHPPTHSSPPPTVYSSALPTPPTRPCPRASDPSLPLHPPKFLLNPSLQARCFRCFAKGHRAARCSKPRRCLLCMQVSHPASRCPSRRSPSHTTMEPHTISGRPFSVAAFLPSRPPPAGHPCLSGCVARVDIGDMPPDFVKDVLPRGLAAKYGGASRDYKLASFQHSAMAIFFPNWVVRGSAISRSPLRFENSAFRISNWVEVGEFERGHLQHKVWIRLFNWPILCWNVEDVTAAISSFGEL